MLNRLQHIDTHFLALVVQQDQNSPDFEITDWSVSKLSEQGAINPDGLFMFYGNGKDSHGTRSWSIVLKIVKDNGGNADPGYNWYWKREVLAYQSGLLAGLPGPIRAARGYGVQEFPDEAWIWLEHVHDRLAGRWGLKELAFSAHELGHFNGSCLASPVIRDYPWLNKGQAQDWAHLHSPEGKWDDPIVRQNVPERTIQRLQEIWENRGHVFEVLDTLPAAFSHFDYKRRNLFLTQKPDGSDELVAIDWAECGIGALGRDLSFVVGTNTFFLEYDPYQIDILEQVALENYLSGLHKTNWDGDPDFIHLAYDIWVSFKFGIILPGMVRNTLASEESRAHAIRFFHHPAEEMVAAWIFLCDYLFKCAAEARRLEKKLLKTRSYRQAAKMRPVL